MKNLRLWLPVLALAGLISAGCFLVSGQFTITVAFSDPITIVSPSAVLGQNIDLNTEPDYNDHKSQLKEVSDVALLGTFTNLNATATSVEIWMVATPGAALTTDAAVRAAGQKVWGPMALAGSQAKVVGWDESAQLFTGRQALIDQVKGDGEFALYALASGSYSFRINKGAFIAVISAGK